MGEHLQALTDKITAHSTTGTPAGLRGEGEPGSILRHSRHTGLARGLYGAAGTPGWPEGGGGEGRAGRSGTPPYGSAGTPDWHEGPCRRHSRNAGLARGRRERGRTGGKATPPHGTAGTPDRRKGPYSTARTPDWLEGGREGGGGALRDGGGPGKGAQDHTPPHGSARAPGRPLATPPAATTPGLQRRAQAGALSPPRRSDTISNQVA